MLSELKTTLKHSSIYGAANLLKKGAAFFMIPVYTRFLSPSDYGTLELLELVLDVAFLMIGLRMSEAIIRYYHHYSSEEDKVEVVSTAFLFSLMVSLSAVIAFQFFLEPIAGLVFNDPANAGYLKWVFVCLGFQLMFIVPETYLIVKKRSLTYSSLSFASFFLALSLNLFFLVKLKLGIWGMIYSMAITKLSYMVLLFIWVVPHLKLTFSPGKLKELIRFGLPMLPGVLALFTINFSDRFFIQQFCDSHELGIYSLGYKFGMLLVVLMTDPFFRIWNTQRFEIASQDRGSLIIGRYFTYFLGGLLFFALGLSIFSADIIYLMADTRFHSASGIIPLIALSYVFQGIAGFATLGIMVSYKTSRILYANLCAAALNICLNYFLIKAYGIYGAAVATIISYGVLFCILILFSQKLYAITFEPARILRLVFFTALVWGLASHIRADWLTAVGLKLFIFAGLPLMLYLSGFFTDTEREKIKALLS